MESLPEYRWDGGKVHERLAGLIFTRLRFRLNRTIQRMRSPRRVAATLLAVGFFTLYLLNGILVIATRQPADPERLRLWLSGGMVIYAIYHLVRCAWSTKVSDLELTDSEHLWLGGAPVQRSSLAVYHVANMLLPALIKTLLLVVILAIDVQRIELLTLGVFTSLILLETSRLIIARWASALSSRGLAWFRTAATTIAAAVVLHVVANLVARTPPNSDVPVYILNSFRSLGDVAASPIIQWASLPWIPAASMSISPDYSAQTLLQLLATVAIFPLMVLVLVAVDSWSLMRRQKREQLKWSEGDYRRETPDETLARLEQLHDEAGTNWTNQFPSWLATIVAVVQRHWVTIRQYRSNIVLSLVIPTLLCLSPLLTGKIDQQWFFVVGGIALSTLLLAPPALRIDFRRDLKRMLLMRSLPVPARSMVIGQLALPIAITWVFQMFTIAVAALVLMPSWSQVILWTGLLAALAPFTFAMENALFLAYPHHEREQGVGMMIRAKLMFMGKVLVIATSLGLLVAWATVCRNWLGDFRTSLIATGTFVVVAVAIAWAIAAAAMSLTTIMWRRFDFAFDTPPE